MTDAKDIIKLSALEQAALIRAGELSAAELADIYIERCARLNPELTAFVTMTPRRARRRARSLDNRSGPQTPVFWGVPNAVKDIDMLAGVAIKSGSRAFRYLIAPFDGGAAKRMKAAGFTLLGKSTTSEFAILPMTEPDIHPPTRNPWNTGRTSGGSSGGASCAVASGMLPIAHGSDGAGSIRIPASFTGLFGHKHSRGLVPNFYAAADKTDISCSGSTARTVADAAAMLDILRGNLYPHRDSGSLLAQSSADPGKLHIRIAMESPLMERLDPEIKAAVEKTAKVLEGLGHTVEPGPPLAVGEIEDFIPVMARAIANVPVISRKLLQPVSAWLHEIGKNVKQAEIKPLARNFANGILTWFGDADLVLSPTSPLPAPEIGLLDGLGGEEAFYKAAQFGVFTAPFNISGQPASSVPAGFTSAGLPIGVQLIGPPAGDLRVLQIASQLEKAMPWRERLSPYFAK